MIPKWTFSLSFVDARTSNKQLLSLSRPGWVWIKRVEVLNTPQEECQSFSFHHFLSEWNQMRWTVQGLTEHKAPWRFFFLFSSITTISNSCGFLISKLQPLYYSVLLYSRAITGCTGSKGDTKPAWSNEAILRSLSQGMFSIISLVSCLCKKAETH